MIEEKLHRFKLYEFIVDFKLRYGLEPGIGFLAGYFKVTKRTIIVKLQQLERDGVIERIKKNVKSSHYKLL